MNSALENDEDDVAAVGRLREAYQRITRELAKVIVGQQRVIEELLIALFAELIFQFRFLWKYARVLERERERERVRERESE
jgi:hypothetical protein